MKIEMEAIGYVGDARRDIQDDFWGGQQTWIDLTESFEAEALRGLAEFSHVEVLFLFHRVAASNIVNGARHPRDDNALPAVGIFAQRAKNRPNRIGSTICRLVEVKGTKLLVAELDAISGTPVLDLKPVMCEFLPREPIRQPAWSREVMKDYWIRKPGT
jgi:tRNA (adenine37-N6)-methyltransferase